MDRISMKLNGFFAVLVFIFLLVVSAEAVKAINGKQKLFHLKMV